MPLPNIKPEAIPIPRVEVSANLDDFPEEIRPAIAHHIDRKVKGVKVDTLGGECKAKDGRFVCEAVLPNFPVVDKAGNPFDVHGVQIEVSNVEYVARRIPNEPATPPAPPPASRVNGSGTVPEPFPNHPPREVTHATPPAQEPVVESSETGSDDA